MRLGLFFHFHLCRFRMPVLILRAKPLNVWLAEILLRPSALVVSN